jgi:hypothetical protein
LKMKSVCSYCTGSSNENRIQTHGELNGLTFPHIIYRVYTKEWCVLYVYIHINRTILLCIPCIQYTKN